MTKKGKKSDWRKSEAAFPRQGVISKFRNGLKHETKHSVLAVFCIVAALLLLLAKFGSGQGVVGAFVYYLHALVGWGDLLFPAIAIALGYQFIRCSARPHLVSTALTGGGLFLLSCLGITDIIFGSAVAFERPSGLLGQFISFPLLKLFGVAASIIILTAVAVTGLLIMLDTRLTLDGKLFGKRLWGRDIGQETGDRSSGAGDADSQQIKVAAQTEAEIKIAQPEQENKSTKKQRLAAPAAELSEEEFSTAFRRRGEFIPPPLSLLEEDSGKPGVGDIKANSNIIKRTLLNFGINVEMDEISIGPSVTRYALKPAEGVKISRIVTLQNDLALALAAHPLRIEAPIPGKSLVGIEIPNTTKTIVRLGSMLASELFAGSSRPLLVALGRTVSGVAYFADLARAPHLLIAGATGSGKSVTIHAIILSLLYRNSPEALRLIMIDPKRVELTLYNKIPHLLTPVITDAKKSILALRWAAKEMERRYDILEKTSSRDIFSYHKNILEPTIAKSAASGKSRVDEWPDPMPYIIIVLDELADIMSTYPRELEAAVVRLAQMSRAVGLHLILSTQRPSTDVITGLIKANIPSRVALQVPSQIDSRTIIDMPGAEKLLGSGDMLYLGGEMSKPVRLQSSFVAENEVKKVTKYLIDQYEDTPPEEIHISAASGEAGTFAEQSFSEFGGNADDDELYEAAREAVTQAGKASTSYLQRKLKVGYARAARLIDMLEERGVVGPGEGAKPREVYRSSDSGNVFFPISNEAGDDAGAFSGQSTDKGPGLA